MTRPVAPSGEDFAAALADPASRTSVLLEAARATKGFMPDDEGLALAQVAFTLAATPALPATVVEIGAYCGRSSLYLACGLAAGVACTEGRSRPAAEGRPAPVVFSVDHHHGSEENQAGWEHHDATLVDRRTGRMDTLPYWRRNVDDAGAADLVIGIVGDSQTVAAHWRTPVGMLFIDGGHGDQPAWADYRGWAPQVAEGSWLAIHDVFPDPADGGRPPYELYRHALDSGEFVEEPGLGRGSLRVMRRVRQGP